MTQSATLSRKETWSLLVLVGASLGVIVNTFQGDGEPLIASIAFSGIAYAATFSLIRWLGPVFMKAGLKGKDMAKPRKPEMWEFLECAKARGCQLTSALDRRLWARFAQLYICFCLLFLSRFLFIKTSSLPRPGEATGTWFCKCSKSRRVGTSTDFLIARFVVSFDFYAFVVLSWLNDYPSLRPISPACFLCNRSSSWESGTTCLTSDGDTRF